ncbi:hypothetical protein VFPPC_15409 [Pochonia chlamydosporia 170]|uniref:Uncharacterized protein n=1 Tax=Pochonia chlamydosporia 170 TaxID=1380566 RepID=A0A179G8E6_METCM|nr:hypothetical protein VFPPC_15409 [Pochonia chlamydosporia 170]OAQ74075.2 hypothetical protein VFPPC_15409 [Pochonia chlamydosporia 170]
MLWTWTMGTGNPTNVLRSGASCYHRYHNRALASLRLSVRGRVSTAVVFHRRVLHAGSSASPNRRPS